ncbi:hypothetical protein Tco_1173434 [Tanacetum coccineum]
MFPDGSTIKGHGSTLPGFVSRKDSEKVTKHVFSPPISSRSDFVITRKKLIHNSIDESKKPSLKPSLKSGIDPITPPAILTPSPVLPPSLLFDPRYFFVPKKLLPPKKRLGQKDKIAFAHYRISDLEQIIEKIQALDRMPPKRTSTSETPAITLDAIRQLVADSVATALKAQAANMAYTDNTNKNIRTSGTPIARKGINNHKKKNGNNKEKDEKQSQNDKTGTRNGKDVKDKTMRVKPIKSIKSKSQQKSQLVKDKINPSQPRGQSQRNISLGTEIVNPLNYIYKKKREYEWQGVQMPFSNVTLQGLNSAKSPKLYIPRDGCASRHKLLGDCAAKSPQKF